MIPLPRRVVHLASGREWRGGQRQVLLLAKGLAGRLAPDSQVVVTRRRAPLAEALIRAGIRVRGVGWRIAVSPAALLGAWRESAGAPSLLHAHDSHAAILAGTLALLTRQPFVATRHVTFPLRSLGFWARADRVIAVSDAVRAALIADGIPAARIIRVHSGIDLEEMREVRPGAIRRELGLPEEGPLAVAVGALTPEKDHALLLQAAAILSTRRPELRWAVAGEGPLRTMLEERIVALGLGDRVRLLGNLPEARRLIAAGQVLVLSSRSEALGSAVLEAMALRVPIAATRVGGVPELLDGGGGLLSPAGDAEALAESVERLLAEPGLTANATERAATRVAAFSAGAMADGVLSVYRSIMGESRAQ